MSKPIWLTQATHHHRLEGGNVKFVDSGNLYVVVVVQIDVNKKSWSPSVKWLDLTDYGLKVRRYTEFEVYDSQVLKFFVKLRPRVSDIFT